MRGALGGRALEDAPDALGHAVRLDGDEVVSEVNRPALCVVGDEDDASSGGEGERVWGEGREERLERLHHEREVWGRVGTRWRERCKHKLNTYYEH